MQSFNHPLEALRHHVSGAVERGEAEPIVAIPAPSKFELVHFNRHECEIGRYPIVADELGAPLMLATLAQSIELRSALDLMEPGDRLEFVERF
jgi:hypothetical protein